MERGEYGPISPRILAQSSSYGSVAEMEREEVDLQRVEEVAGHDAHRPIQ